VQGHFYTSLPVGRISGPNYCKMPKAAIMQKQNEDLQNNLKKYFSLF